MQQSKRDTDGRRFQQDHNHLGMNTTCWAYLIWGGETKREFLLQMHYTRGLDCWLKRWSGFKFHGQLRTQPTAFFGTCLILLLLWHMAINMIVMLAPLEARERNWHHFCPTGMSLRPCQSFVMKLHHMTTKVGDMTRFNNVSILQGGGIPHVDVSTICAGVAEFSRLEVGARACRSDAAAISA